jgi:hypothetical protein
MVAAAGGSDVISSRTAVLATCWILLSLLAITVLYQRVMLINRVSTPKTPEALEDRAVEALGKIGYSPDSAASTAYGMGWSLDYANFIGRTSTEPDRWKRLATERPEALYLWYRTSPRPLIPFGGENRVAGLNPPLNAGGMTLIVVDASGRLSEFVAVPQPIQENAPHAPTNWTALFEAAAVPMASFSPVAPRVLPPVFADERMAWEGHLPQLPDQLFRIEAAGYGGKPVYFVVSGQWSQSSRAPQAAVPLFNVVISGVAAFIMPSLMLAGALLARRNVKLGRGDRQGAFRAATFVVLTQVAVWILDPHVMPLSTDVNRFFAALGSALFDAALLWLTYLGLEPYVRRYSPDSLIGWTRLLAGRWRDPRVGADVMAGVCAGLAMTVFYAAHNVVPPLFGRPEPMPFAIDPTLLLGARPALAALIGRISGAVQQSMLGVVGMVALLIWLRKPWLATLAGIVIFTPVALAGMFPAGTPWLDLAIGGAIISVFVITIVRYGVLATMAALATHFVLLRSPVTLQASSWRAPIGVWFVATIVVAGIGSVYIAHRGAARTT